MRTALTFAAVSLALLSAGADAPAPDRPKSPAATAAIARAEKSAADADARHRANLLGVRRAELEELKAAQAAALKGGPSGLAEANAIDAEIKRVQAEVDAAKSPAGADVDSLAGWVAHEGTFRYGHWESKDLEPVKFLPDGKVVDRKGEARFRWSATGGRLSLSGAAGTITFREDEHHNFHGRWPNESQDVVLLPDSREP